MDLSRNLFETEATASDSRSPEENPSFPPSTVPSNPSSREGRRRVAIDDTTSEYEGGEKKGEEEDLGVISVDAAAGQKEEKVSGQDKEEREYRTPTLKSTLSVRPFGKDASEEKDVTKKQSGDEIVDTKRERATELGQEQGAHCSPESEGKIIIPTSEGGQDQDNEAKMNYFRSRFQRHQASSSSSALQPSSLLNPENLIRDYRRRRREGGGGGEVSPSPSPGPTGCSDVAGSETHARRSRLGRKPSEQTPPPALGTREEPPNQKEDEAEATAAPPIRRRARPKIPEELLSGSDGTRNTGSTDSYCSSSRMRSRSCFADTRKEEFDHVEEPLETPYSGDISRAKDRQEKQQQPRSRLRSRILREATDEDSTSNRSIKNSHEGEEGFSETGGGRRRRNISRSGGSLRRKRLPVGEDESNSEDDYLSIKKGNYTIEMEQTVYLPLKPSLAEKVRASEGSLQSTSTKEEKAENDKAGSGVETQEKSVPPMSNEENLEDKEEEEKEQEEEEEEMDPLNFIEIKSAAQWKAMSGRISWKFEKEEDENEEPVKEVVAPEKPKYNFSVSVAKSSGQDVTGLEGFKPTKVQQLRLMCWKVKPWNQAKEQHGTKLFSSQFAAAWGVDCDEVFPGLFIGDKQSASNVAFLQKIGITHILNTAEGKDEGLVDLCQEHYLGSNIKYLGFPLWDTPTCNIIPYLGCASEYIAGAIDSGGKCLVNCQMGVSRSSSCAMSYLMIKKSMKAVDVLTQFRKHRDVRPNDGFMEQIISLDNDLRRHREHGLDRQLLLSSLKDHPHLPQAWNYEFWTEPMPEEELGHPLVKLGEPCPIIPPPHLSVTSSRGSSRALSRKSSSRRSLSKRPSLRSSRASPTSISRQGSFRSTTSSKSMSLNQKIESGQEDPANQEDWEWVWEDEDEEGQQFENQENTDPAASPLTTEKLEKVKDIIEKPEDRWRNLWKTSRNGFCCDTPSSSVGSVRSFGSNLSNVSAANQIQPGVEGGDPLSLVKVSSAKQWKAISQKLSINLDGIDLEDNKVHPSIESPEIRPSTPTEFIPTKVEQLRRICWRVKPWDQPKASRGRLFSSIFASGWGVDCDEVHPNIFIGDEASARNIKFLNRMGITHVLNTAEGVWKDHSFVDLTAEYYQGSGITYQGFELWDSTKVKISPYFGCANEFISSALKSGGKCLVNCQMGVSRSCASAMAYMMISEGWDAQDVMREFRKRRDVRPNDFFLSQLVDLDNALRKERQFNIPNKMKLLTLADIPKIPKPWHYEFWDTEPESDSLPFVLSHFGEPRDYVERINNVKSSPVQEESKLLELKTMESTDQGNVTMRNNRNCSVSRSHSKRNSNNSDKRISSASSTMTTESGDWEWEYYDTEDESDHAPEEEMKVPEDYNDHLISLSKVVGSAKEWKNISDRLSRGELKIKEEEEEEKVEEEEQEPQLKDIKDFVPTTEKQMRLICWKVKPWNLKKDNKMFSSQFAVLWNVDCDEVYPNLFIGDAAAATSLKFLQHLKITHVLNTAEGDDEGLVNLNQEHYVGTNITYKGLHMWDNAWFDIAPFLDEAVGYIADAMDSGGRCLVNCQMGVSRSSTCAITYMMQKRGWNAVDVLKQFRQNRDVRPNDGFLKTIVAIDNRLRLKREGFEK